MQHESTAAPSPKRQLFFDYFRRKYDYTQPWEDMCGLPFDDFGPSLELAPGQDAKCKNPECKQVLRSLARQDGKLELKEKLQRPELPGEPEKPQYVVVNYRRPPGIVKDGELMVNRRAHRRMKASILAVVVDTRRLRQSILS